MTQKGGNILVISHLFPNAYSPGYGIFIQEQLKALKRYRLVNRIETLVGVYLLSGEALLQNELGRNPILTTMGNEGDVSYVRGMRNRRLLRINLLIILFRFYRLLKKIEQTTRHHLVHAHFAYPDGIMAAILSRVFSIPFVVTCHGSDIFLFTKNGITERLIRVALKRSSRVFCVSSALADRVRSLGVKEERVMVIPNGIDLSVFFPRDKKKARRELSLDENGKYILYVGNLVDFKGVMDLLEAFIKVRKNRPDVRLLYVGEGPCRLRIMEESEKAGVLRDVVILGQQPHADIPLWMSAADVLVLPSHTEGFGVVLVESLGCGTPVIGSNVGGIPEIVNSPEVGAIVPPMSPDRLSGEIVNVLETKWDVKKLIARAVDFSDEKVAHRLAEQYRMVREETRSS